MSDRQLHPVQKQYLDTQDKIKELEVAMMPMKVEMRQLKKQLREQEGILVSWLRRHFPESCRAMGRSAQIEMAAHLDASTVPSDEPTGAEANK